HAPEIYKNKAELNKLAELLSGRVARPLPQGVPAEASAATKIEFTDKSATNFLAKLAAQKAAFEKESTLTRGIIKYPLGAAGSGMTPLLKPLILIGVVAQIMFSAFTLGFGATAVVSAIATCVGFCIYTSLNQGPTETWTTAAKGNM